MGALLGLAAGDALGTTLEFKKKGSFAPIDDMVGGGPFGLKPGQWTDDTSMALCLAESLADLKSFDPRDQMARYVRWWREYAIGTGASFISGPLPPPSGSSSPGYGSPVRSKRARAPDVDPPMSKQTPVLDRCPSRHQRT